MRNNNNEMYMWQSDAPPLSNFVQDFRIQDFLEAEEGEGVPLLEILTKFPKIKTIKHLGTLCIPFKKSP